MKNIIKVLRERGFIEAVTSDELEIKAHEPLSVYCGFDPTSDSLHLGNLVAVMGLAWFQRCGHRVIAIVGGATGMVGDPSGRNSERVLLDEETIAKNLIGIRQNLESVLDMKTAKILNNYDWFKNFSFIDFLRDVGKLFRMGPMLSKESVKTRLESAEGMSFTEFSYQTLQGYDFLHLYRHEGVNVQMGGSDQWGNITAGSELIRKTLGESVYGLTFPLLTRSDGQKFGKSEKGAIWLASQKTSPYEFYQYLVRVSDEDVIKLLCLLTFLEMDEIRKIENAMSASDYIPNTAQKRLAQELTLMIHGKEGLERAIKATDAARPGSQTLLDAQVLESIASDMPSCEMELDKVEGASVIDLLCASGMVQSKGEGRRLIRAGGVSVNNVKIEDENSLVVVSQLIDGRLLLLAIGKKNKMLIKLT